MKVCPVCGYPNPDDAIYCARCGYRFPTTSQQYGPQQQSNPTFTQPQPSYSQQPPQQPNPPQNPAQPGAPPSYGLTPDEINGLKKIRKSSLFYIVGLILLLIAFIPALISSGISLTAFIAGSSVTLALIIAGGIISILSFFYLLSAYSSLRRVDSDFNLPYYGLLIILIAAIIGVLGAIALLSPGFVLAILPLYGLVAILGIIGYVMGFIIGPFRLNNRYNEGDFKLAGIMYIVGIFIGFFAIIGTIFMYLGAGKVLRRAGVT